MKLHLTIGTFAGLVFLLAAPASANGPEQCVIECPAGPPGATGATGPAGPPGPTGPPGAPAEEPTGVAKVCHPQNFWYACKRGSTAAAAEGDKKAHLCSEDLLTGEIERYAKTGRNLMHQVAKVARIYNMAEHLCDPALETPVSE